jgi:hypothetical protein
VISAAFIITLAAGLLFFLIKRASRPRTTGRVRTLIPRRAAFSIRLPIQARGMAGK